MIGDSLLVFFGDDYEIMIGCIGCFCFGGDGWIICCVWLLFIFNFVKIELDCISWVLLRELK